MKQPPVVKISARPDTFWQFLQRVYQHRFLIETFTRRGLKIKYAQTFLGVTWSLIQPLTGLLIFSLFFNYIIQFEGLTMSYPVYAFTGITIWNYFSYIFSTSSTALREASDLIQKFSFPKVLFLFSKAFIGLVEFLMAFSICLVLIFVFSDGLSYGLIFIPLIVIGIALTALGLGQIVAASTLKFRDAYHIVPYLVNFGIWFTPIFFPTHILPEIMQKAMWFNPMAGYAEFFRWALLGGEMPNFYYFFGILLGILLFILGLIYMKKTEDQIVDLL